MITYKSILSTLNHKYIYKKTYVLQNQLTDKQDKQYLRKNLTFVDTEGDEFMNSHITLIYDTLTLLMQIDDHKQNFDC